MFCINFLQEIESQTSLESVQNNNNNVLKCNGDFTY